MEVSKQDIRLLIHFSWALGNPINVIYKQLVQVHGEGVCSIETVRNWVKKFENGDFNISDLARSGRPPRADLATLVQQELEDSPFMSAHALAEELGENRSMIRNVLKNQLKLTRLSLRWVPHEPTAELLDKRLHGATDLLGRLSSLKPQQLNHVVTGDQTWVFLRNDPSKMWGKRGENTPVRVKRSRGDKKIMLTVMFSRKGILTTDFLPIGQKFNSLHMTSVVIPKLVEKIRESCPSKGTCGWFLHLDNSPVHNCRVTRSAIENSGFKIFPQPPYSPDLAPSDFSLFGYLKDHLTSKKSLDMDELKVEIIDFLENIHPNWFEHVWDEWDKRLRWVIENNGKYYSK